MVLLPPNAAYIRFARKLWTLKRESIALYVFLFRCANSPLQLNLKINQQNKINVEKVRYTEKKI